MRQQEHDFRIRGFQRHIARSNCAGACDRIARLVMAEQYFRLLALRCNHNGNAIMQHVGNHVSQSRLVAWHIADAVRTQQNRFRPRRKHRFQPCRGNAGCHIDHRNIMARVRLRRRPTAANRSGIARIPMPWRASACQRADGRRRKTFKCPARRLAHTIARKQMMSKKQSHTVESSAHRGIQRARDIRSGVRLDLAKRML